MTMPPPRRPTSRKRGARRDPHTCPDCGQLHRDGSLCADQLLPGMDALLVARTCTPEGWRHVPRPHAPHVWVSAVDPSVRYRCTGYPAP